jgi:hypothetical protein
MMATRCSVPTFDGAFLLHKPGLQLVSTNFGEEHHIVYPGRKMNFTS